MATKDKVISAGTGRRKTACARVTLVPGEGKWTVNRVALEEYITSEALRDYLKQPIAIAGFDASKVNVVVFAILRHRHDDHIVFNNLDVAIVICLWQDIYSITA